MEPMRGVRPKKGFLQEIRKIASKNKIVLIFDEITSGFHDTYGGIHLDFKVNPDIVIYGKSFGNGYPISAIVGKKKIMDVSQDTFISSTMWTDKIGFVAANKTLEILKKDKINKKLVKIGKEVRNSWLNISKESNVPIDVFGQYSMPGFVFKKNHRLLSTFFTQEMLKRGYLANTTITICDSYNSKIIKNYLINFRKVFQIIKSHYKQGKEIKLKNPLKHNTFQRLTG